MKVEAELEDNKDTTLEFCKIQIEAMLKRSKTKVLFPILTFGLLQCYKRENKTLFLNEEVNKSYKIAVKFMKDYLKHELHIGGKYYDAYPSRNLPKYGVLKVLENKKYQLLEPYLKNSASLIDWIPKRIKEYIDLKIGLIPKLSDRIFRIKLSEDKIKFLEIVKKHMDENANNFEVFSFAIIKVHLEKFACKVYRDSKTSSHDKGTDLSTNFGVVYQIKKLKIDAIGMAKNIYAELRTNFANERFDDGKVILIIDDISKEVKSYLINMKVQSISKSDILKLARQFDDAEDREKILRIIYEEFSREYLSDIK